MTFPSLRLCRVQNRISKGFEVFEYYANNVWSFDNSEAVKLRKLMNNRERKTYVIEKIDLDLIDYFTNCVLCARRLILKESDESIPAARRHMKMFVLLPNLHYYILNYFSFTACGSWTRSTRAFGSLAFSICSIDVFSLAKLI